MVRFGITGICLIGLLHGDVQSIWLRFYVSIVKSSL